MSREAMQMALDALERYEYAEARVILRAALSEPKKCKYGDPMCPCQDGDMCHYEGENSMTPPANEPVQEPVAWMNPAANVFARHKEGADNFGCTVPLYAAPPGYVLVPVEPTEEMMMAGAQAIAENIRASFSVGVTKVIYNALLSAAG